MIAHLGEAGAAVNVSVTLSHQSAGIVSEGWGGKGTARGGKEKGQGGSERRVSQSSKCFSLLGKNLLNRLVFFSKKYVIKSTFPQ